MCRFSMYAYFVYIAVFCILMTATNSAVYYVVNLGICFCSNPCTNGVVICISEFFYVIPILFIDFMNCGGIFLIPAILIFRLC